MPDDEPTELDLLNLQIKAEKEAGMFKPRDHANQFLPRCWDHPLDGVQPIPMGPGRRDKLTILRAMRGILDLK